MDRVSSVATTTEKLFFQKNEYGSELKPLVAIIIHFCLTKKVYYYSVSPDIYGHRHTQGHKSSEILYGKKANRAATTDDEYQYK